VKAASSPLSLFSESHTVSADPHTLLRHHYVPKRYKKNKVFLSALYFVVARNRIHIILLEVLLKPGAPYCGHFVSLTHSPATPVLTRGGYNPPKKKSQPLTRQKITSKANSRNQPWRIYPPKKKSRQKQTVETDAHEE
jgi:hypothetical protein